jgi:hypothetical protein
MSTTQTNGHGLDEALAEIMRIAQTAIDEEEAELAEYEMREAGPEAGGGTDEAGEDGQAPVTGCRVMALPDRLNEQAARIAVDVNPVNGPLLELPGGVLEPMALAVLTAKYWGVRQRRFTVSFMEPAPADLRRRIVSHLNAWGRTANKTFVQTRGTGQVRISRGPGGYYSYLGTDIRLVPQNRQTMNLERFTMRTPESEFRRVVRHEAGHTLGFPHEHLRKELVARIDPARAYRYFRENYGWTKEMVDRNVLTPLDEASILGTRPDQDSIMCYQLPGSITYDGQPIRGGTDINRLDYAFAGRIYPKGSATTGSDADEAAEMSLTADWDPSEDVAEPVPA